MALVSNDSLTPTRLDPKVEFTPSKYPDRGSVIAAFRRAVSVNGSWSLRGKMGGAGLFAKGDCLRSLSSVVGSGIRSNPPQVQMALDNPEDKSTLNRVLREFHACVFGMAEQYQD